MEQKPRKNGLERPFHLFQIISWITQVFNVFSMFLVVAPCLKKEIQIFILPCYIFIQILVVYFGYKLSKSDPTDETVEIFNNG